MIRSALLLAALVVLPPCFGQKGEIPPYDPAPPSDRMSAYTNRDLAFTVLYPREFASKTPQDLQAVMERGHRMAFGGDPKSDPEHRQAVRCMHTLFYATAEPATENRTPASGDDSLDTILVEDVDPSCVPKKVKGDKVLTNLVGTVLHLPDSTQLVPQMWFVAGGGRRIHSGLAGSMVTLGKSSGQTVPNSPSKSVPLFVIAAGVEQRGHRILIVYLSGTSGGRHETIPHMSIAFEDGRPVLLFPFLMGKANLVK